MRKDGRTEMHLPLARFVPLLRRRLLPKARCALFRYRVSAARSAVCCGRFSHSAMISAATVVVEPRIRLLHDLHTCREKLSHASKSGRT
jgi:hypothetical protein